MAAPSFMQAPVAGSSIAKGTTPPAAAVGVEWYDTTYNILKVYNGFDWVPGVDHVLDRSEKIDGSFTVPTSAVSSVTAVAVTGLTITPVCPPGPIKIKAAVLMSHGATGWSAGRFMNAFIGDATLNATAPVPLSASASTHASVTGAAQIYYMEIDHPIALTDAGTRTYSIYTYVSNVNLTTAFVYGDSTQASWIEAVIDV